jgi:uncharacterized protein YhaN
VRFKRINLKAFGPFKDYELDFGENGKFNLIYGLNEAGKTTVLRAITDFLYGIPQRSPDAFFHPPARLRIEAVLETGSGKELWLARRKGNRNTLLDEKNRAVDEKILQKLLGSIDRRSFSLMFGMDHLSLRRGGEDLLKGQGQLGEVLFEAASGIGGLREIFKELGKEAGELFKAGGSRPPVNVNAKRYVNIKKKISELSLVPKRWADLERRYLTEKNQVDVLKQEEKELVKEKSRLERLEKTLPLVARRSKYLEDTKNIGDVPLLPSTFKEERLDLINRRNTAINSKERAQKEIEELKKEAENITLHEELLGHAEDISILQERLDTYRNYIKDIPSLEGEQKELQEEGLSLLHQLKPSLSTLEEAESLRLPFDRAEEIKRLIKEHPILLNNYNVAQEKVKELERSLQKQVKEKKKIDPQKEAADLFRCLNRARKEGSPEEELRKTQSAADALEKILKSKLDSLGLWHGNFEELLHLPLPLEETLRSFEENYSKIKNQADEVQKAVKEEEKRLADYQEQLSTVEFAGDVPTQNSLEEARKHRQRGWHLVRRAWLEGVRDNEEERAFSGEHPLELAYEISVTNADEIADRLRYEAGRVERKTIILAEMKKCREKIEVLKGEKQSVEKQKQGLDNKWIKAWQEAGITPLTPREMLTWLSRCQEIKDGIYKLNEYRDLILELRETIKKHKDEISRELQKLGEAVAGEKESLEMLIDRAQEVYDKYQEAHNRLKRIEEMCREIEENLERARQQEDGVRTALESWEQNWSAALSQAGLSAGTTVEVVTAYLERLQRLFEIKEEISREQAKLEKMKKYSREFKSRVQVLLDRLAPELTEMPVDYAASQLQARVTKAQRDKDKRESLEEQITKVQKTYNDALRDIEETNNSLKELIKQARCTDESQLPGVEERSERLQKLRESTNELEEHLLSIGGGLSLEQIIAEAEGVNADALTAELSEIEQKLEENRQKQDHLNQVFGATRKEYEEKIKGASTEALDAAEEAEGVLEELRAQAEQYFLLRLASIVLRRGIERYREENQSPVIKKAGEFFARLTRGSFIGLTVDFDEKDNPILLGLRAKSKKGENENEGVKVEGMSEGTLDQLFLSLRLASLENYLEQNEPLPFILDDLLVNFDDKRTAETLQVLGEFAENTQILFFTHHASLVELAEQTIAGSNIIYLE